MSMVVSDGFDLETVLNSQETAIVIMDLKGIVLHLNRKAEDNAYLTNPPIKPGVCFFDSLILERRELIKKKVSFMIDNHIPFSTNVVFQDKSGKKVYLDLRYSLIADNLDGELHLMMEAVDVSPYKAFETKITSVAAELTNLIEHANAVIIGLDTQGYVTEWNDKTFQLTGFSKSNMLARKFVSDIVVKEQRSPLEDLLEEVFQGGLITNFELKMRGADHRTLTVLINGTPRKNLVGQTIGVFIVGQDITELVDYRASLEKKINDRTKALRVALQKEKELVEMKNRFVSIASHEFRTPLESIRFVTDSIRTQGQKLSRTEVMGKLENIDKQVNLMVSLLDDVLTYGKSEAGKIQLILTVISLKPFVRHLIEEVCNSTGNTHVVHLDDRQGPEEIHADEKLLRSILVNLLTNAIKFSPERREIFLAVNEMSDSVLIRVTDEGMGVAEDELEKIFEPFHRSKDSGSIKGTGLGLNIVRKSVDLLNGTIQVKSKRGVGTTFNITIPKKQNG